MKITCNSSTYIYLAFLLLLLPIKWLTAWLIAVCFHELCHCLAVKLCGGENYHLRVGFGGAVISCSDLTNRKHLFSLLAGPLGGFLLVFLGRWFPRLALCSWVLSMYNLLPFLPLDGGQALRLLLSNDRKFNTFEKIGFILLTICSICISILMHLGVLPIVIVGILWVKNRKSPCKEQTCKVQ